MTTTTKIALIDAGFIAKNDCNGEEYYSHECGVCCRQSEAAWIVKNKLRVAKNHNV